jgi:uncharacterized membrane protein (DUF2068 family)
MTDSPSRLFPSHRRHNTGLILIAAFKLCQALLFAAIGVGALKLLHKDVGDLLRRVAEHPHFNPESRLIDFLLARSSLFNDHLLRRIGEAVFIYASIDLVEAIGLYLEKAWAEYLTLAITASFLPWEVIEICNKLTLIRISLLTLNVLVFVYLLKIVLAHARRNHPPGSSPQDE